MAAVAPSRLFQMWCAGHVVGKQPLEARQRMRKGKIVGIHPSKATLFTYLFAC